jgi:hypothetical protein
MTPTYAKGKFEIDMVPQNRTASKTYSSLFYIEFQSPVSSVPVS